jgi:hypothetical protein
LTSPRGARSIRRYRACSQPAVQGVVKNEVSPSGGSHSGEACRYVPKGGEPLLPPPSLTAPGRRTYAWRTGIGGRPLRDRSTHQRAPFDWPGSPTVFCCALLGRSLHRLHAQAASRFEITAQPSSAASGPLDQSFKSRLRCSPWSTQRTRTPYTHSRHAITDEICDGMCGPRGRSSRRGTFFLEVGDSADWCWTRQPHPARAERHWPQIGDVQSTEPRAPTNA